MDDDVQMSAARELWAKEMAYLRRLSVEARRLREQGVTGGRTWSRDDIHEDRYKRPAC